MANLTKTPLIRLFIVNGAFGALLGPAFVAAALAFDVQGLGGLVANSEHAVLAVSVLTFSLSATFAAAAIGTAVMLLPTDEERFRAIGRDDDESGGRS